MRTRTRRRLLVYWVDSARETLMELADEQRCEVCGDPAIVFLLDLVRRYDYGKSCCHYEPDGDVHRFCDKHKRDSIIEL